MEEERKTIIVFGNQKLGRKTKIAHVSLPPGISCVPGIPCFKKGCYSKKEKRFPIVVESRNNNWALLKENINKYFQDIREFIIQNRVNTFRWHTSGDIPNQEYFDRMNFLAEEFTKTKFMAFTKRYELDFSRRKENLNVIISTWPGYPISEDLIRNFPTSWVMDGAENRIPKNAKKCVGLCKNCFLCWNLNKNESVWFKKH